MKTLSICFIGLLLVSCAQAAMEPTAAAVQATESTLPPTVLSPTETPVPISTSTPLPEGVLFRDDFIKTLQPGWTWENEDLMRRSLTDDGWLSLTADDGSLLAGQTQTNLLWRDLPEGDFEIVVHLKADPGFNFQQAAIFLYEDPEHYIGLNHGFCDKCVPGGKGVFMDYKIGKDWGAYKQAYTESDLYLKLAFEPQTISAYYAASPDAWQRLGRFGNIFKFKRVGLGAANIDVQGHGQDLLALYDYFEIRKLP